jgi:hypothetical protein
VFGIIDIQVLIGHTYENWRIAAFLSDPEIGFDNKHFFPILRNRYGSFSPLLSSNRVPAFIDHFHPDRLRRHAATVSPQPLPRRIAYGHAQDIGAIQFYQQR